MEPIVFDETCRPLLLVILPDRKLSDDEWSDYLYKRAECRKKWGEVLLLAHSRTPKHVPDARQRAFIAQHEAVRTSSSYDHPTIVAMPTNLIRVVSVAISWLIKDRERKIIWANDLADAVEKAVEYGRAHGMGFHGDPWSLVRTYGVAYGA